MLRIGLGIFKWLILFILSVVVQNVFSQRMVEINSNNMDKKLMKILNSYVVKHPETKSFLLVSDTNFTYDFAWNLHYAKFLIIGPFFYNLINTQSMSNCTYDKVVAYNCLKGVSSIINIPVAYFYVNGKIVYVQSSLDKFIEVDKSEIMFDKEAANPILQFLDESEVIKVTYNVYPSYQILDSQYKSFLKHTKIRFTPKIIEK